MGADEYKTRSGRVVVIGEDGSLSIDHKRGYLSPEVVMDVEEWAQAKRDAELGRWRWPENPDYVVYRDTSGDAIVFREQTSVGGILYRRGDDVVDLESEAARAYFEAHPGRKPWQAAKPGEVWILSTADGENAAYSVMTVREAGTVFESHEGRYSLDDADIEDARRIWPEDAS